MTNTFPNRSLLQLSALLMFGLTGISNAQQTTLYDPQPPANSAYVRVIVGGGAQTVDVLTNKSVRLTKLAAQVPSPYLVVPAGAHEVTVQSGSQQISTQIEAKASRSMTIMVPSLSPDAKPIVVDDRTNGNRLKAIISLYQMGSSAPVDVWTADGNTQVFKSVPMGGTAALVVNPINLDYQVTAAGTKTTLAAGRLEMTPGGAYSLVITSAKPGELKVQSHVNSVERYTQQ